MPTRVVVSVVRKPQVWSVCSAACPALLLCGYDTVCVLLSRAARRAVTTKIVARGTNQELRQCCRGTIDGVIQVSMQLEVLVPDRHQLMWARQSPAHWTVDRGVAHTNRA